MFTRWFTLGAARATVNDCMIREQGLGLGQGKQWQCLGTELPLFWLLCIVIGQYLIHVHVHTSNLWLDPSQCLYSVNFLITLACIFSCVPTHRTPPLGVSFASFPVGGSRQYHRAHQECQMPLLILVNRMQASYLWWVWANLQPWY